LNQKREEKYAMPSLYATKNNCKETKIAKIAKRNPEEKREVKERAKG